MSEPSNDWRVTAYALGQADPATAAELAGRAEASAELRDHIRRLRDTGSALSSGFGLLADRWAEGLTAEQKADLRREGAAGRRLRVARRPRLWAAVGALAAAVVLIFLASPPGSRLLTVSYVWLDQVKSSGGHDSATRTGWAGPPVTVWDVLRGRGPAEMAAAGYASGATAQRALGARSARPALDPEATAVLEAARSSGTASRAMVVKDAFLVLEVARLGPAMDRAAAVAVQRGGFVAESAVHGLPYEPDQTPTGAYGSVTLRVPAARFEEAIATLRDIAIRVTQESISGSDVTQEYVDLQSQVANLEATRGRVRGFLDEARTVGEALQVNAELSRLEGEIGVLKGRMEVMADQAAMSTVRLELFTDPPDVAAAETALWDPVRTAKNAWAMLGAILRTLVTIGIWIAIVIVPLWAPFLLLAWWLRRRRLRTRAGT